MNLPIRGRQERSAWRGVPVQFRCVVAFAGQGGPAEKAVWFARAGRPCP